MLKIIFRYKDLITSVEPLTPAEWGLIANKVLRKIKYLLSRGKNANNTMMAGYQKKYEQWKIANVGTYSGVVDWRVTGSLVNSISYKVYPTRFTIKVNGSKNNLKLSYLHKHKNWNVFEWGIVLQRALEAGLRLVLKHRGL